jgi:hypothetical protein
MDDRDYGWTPPEDLTNHGGAPLDAKVDLFAPPPAEIGEVLTADSTLRQGVQPWGLGTRIGLGFLIGCVLAVVVLVITTVLDVDFEWLVGLSAGAGGLALLVTVLATGFNHTCTYVGKQGVARFKCSGSRENLSGSEVFPFHTATELRTTQVRRYVNGVYQGTTYTFTWTDDGGRTRFVINGTHHSEAGNPPPKDAYHFAGASEWSWSRYLYTLVPEQFKEEGAIYFSLGGGDWVRIGQGFMDLCVKGEVTHCDASEVASLHLDKGIFTVKRTDAQEGWFTSKGVFKFNYGNLANAQLFLLLVEDMTGIRIN